MIFHKNPTCKNIILIPFYEVKGPDDKLTCLVYIEDHNRDGGSSY